MSKISKEMHRISEARRRERMANDPEFAKRRKDQQALSRKSPERMAKKREYDRRVYAANREAYIEKERIYVESRRIPCPVCSGFMRYTSKICRKCVKGENHPMWGGGVGRYIGPDGYVNVKGRRGEHGVSRNGYIKEHRRIFQDLLGRALYAGENVHHKNGVRHDNKIENLELWVVLQPQGQRPEDLLVYADEIIARYRTL